MGLLGLYPTLCIVSVFPGGFLQFPCRRSGRRLALHGTLRLHRHVLFHPAAVNPDQGTSDSFQLRGSLSGHGRVLFIFSRAAA